MTEWIEIKKLAQMLYEAGISFEFEEDDILGADLKIPNQAAWLWFGEDGSKGPVTSVIQSRYSYGCRDGLVEIWTRGGKHQTSADSDVRGWMTAEDALQLIRKEHCDGMG